MVYFFKLYSASDLDSNIEYCYYIESTVSRDKFGDETWSVIYDLITHGKTNIMSYISILDNQDHNEFITEFGPNLSVITSWGSNALSILRKAEIKIITRIERSVRTISDKIIKQMFDKMTQVKYKKPLKSFDPKENNMVGNDQSHSYSSTFTIRPSNIRTYNDIYGLGMDDADILCYYNLFKNVLNRNLTNVELVMLGQMNSEHSRHHFFRGKYTVYSLKLSQVEKEKLLDPNYNRMVLTQHIKELDEESLMEKVKMPYLLNVNNSLIAFKDNASCIMGYKTIQLSQSWNLMMESMDDYCESDDEVSTFKLNSDRYLINRRMIPIKRYYHPTLTAETHNFPTAYAPFEGASTGVGGRIRDSAAIGRGGMMLASLAGYAVGNLGITDSFKTQIPEEVENTPLEILINASNGASDYGNKIGEPIIGGYTRSYGNIIRFRKLHIQNKINGNGYTMSRINYVNEHREWFKPVMFSAGIGLIDDNHLQKDAKPGMSIVRVGGPAYRIGIGGGSASSRHQSAENKEIDFSAVQRGDPEMESRVIKFLQNCIEMGINNPIQSIHDQGAGGMANVTAEIPEPFGAMVYMQNVNVGDDSMSDMEVWISEHQEQMTLLVYPNETKLLNILAKRENVPLDIVGTVTEPSDIVAYSIVEDGPDNQLKDLVDYSDDEATEKLIKMVDLPIDDIISKLPTKRYDLIAPYIIWSKKDNPWFNQLNYKDFSKHLKSVLNNVSVGSKQFLTNKVDRSVGRVAQQQCVGMTQVPLSDYSCVAHNYFGTTDITGSLTFPGIVTAIGEQPIKGLYDVDKMVKLSIAEMLNNMIGCVIEDMAMIRCSANWMWANRSPEDKYLLWQAVDRLRTVLSDLCIAIDGGKDSLSMSVNSKKQGEIKSPNALVLTGYVTTPDVRKKINTGFTNAGNKIIYINMSHRHMRLGGSVLSQVIQTMGETIPDEVPDFETIDKYPTLFQFIQYHIQNGIIKSCHDVSDGGLITTLLEMCFPNHLGFYVTRVDAYHNCYETYFHEEPGLVIEVDMMMSNTLISQLKSLGYNQSYLLGQVTAGDINLLYNAKMLLGGHVTHYKEMWEKTSFEIEKRQSNPECVKSEQMESQTMKIYTNRYNIERQIVDRLISLETDVDVLKNILERQPTPGLFAIKVAIIREEGSNGDREMKAAFATAGFQTYDIHMNDLISQKICLDEFKGIVFVGGFSYSDVFGAAQGWAACIQNHSYVKAQFDNFYDREDTFSLGVCNGCQLMALLGWIPYNSRFVENDSGRFESRYSMCTVEPNNSIMLNSLAGLTFGIWSAHGEGKYYSPDINTSIRDGQFSKYSHSFPMKYVNYKGKPTDTYPHNPNGSSFGICAVVSDNGRHLAMMPHPERSYMMWQLAYCPPFIEKEIGNFSPWFLMFRNAYNWCQNKFDTEQHYNDTIENLYEL